MPRNQHSACAPSCPFPQGNNAPTLHTRAAAPTGINIDTYSTLDTLPQVPTFQINLIQRHQQKNQPQRTPNSDSQAHIEQSPKSSINGTPFSTCRPRDHTAPRRTRAAYTKLDKNWGRETSRGSRGTRTRDHTSALINLLRGRPNKRPGAEQSNTFLTALHTQPTHASPTLHTRNPHTHQPH